MADENPKSGIPPAATDTVTPSTAGKASSSSIQSFRSLSSPIGFIPSTSLFIKNRSYVSEEEKEAEFLFYRGNLMLAAGHYESALMCYENTLEKTPLDPLLHKKRAECLMNLKNFEEALISLNKAIEIKPEDAKAQKFLEVLNRMAKEEKEKVEKEKMEKLEAGLVYEKLMDQFYATDRDEAEDGLSEEIKKAEESFKKLKPEEVVGKVKELHNKPAVSVKFTSAQDFNPAKLFLVLSRYGFISAIAFKKQKKEARVYYDDSSTVALVAARQDEYTLEIGNERKQIGVAEGDFWE